MPPIVLPGLSQMRFHDLEPQALLQPVITGQLSPRLQLKSPETQAWPHPSSKARLWTQPPAQQTLEAEFSKQQPLAFNLVASRHCSPNLTIYGYKMSL